MVVQIPAKYQNFWEDLTADTFNGGKDGAAKPIEVDEEVYPDGVNSEEVFKFVEGSQVSVRSLLLAQAIFDGEDEEEGAIIYGGKSSGGLLNKNGSDRRVLGVQDPVIKEPSTLKKMNLSPESRGGRKILRTPGSATPHCVNEFLRANYPGLELYFDVTTEQTATLAACLVTGALGDNRLGIDVVGVTLTLPNGQTYYITDPEMIDALRGSQGLAAYVSEVELGLREVPKKEEQVVLYLDAETQREAYTDSLSEIVTHLYQYFRERDPNGVWVDGVEILDSTGMSTIMRVDPEYNKQELMKDLQRYMEHGKTVSAIMLRVRHNDPGTVSNPQDDDLSRFRESLDALGVKDLKMGEWLAEDGFFGDLEDEIWAMCPDNEDDDDDDEDIAAFTKRVGDYLLEHIDRLPPESQARVRALLSCKSVYKKVDFISEPSKIAEARMLRENVPDHRRQESVASGSNDRDVRLKLVKEGGEDPSPEYIQESVRDAISAVMNVFADIADEAEGLNLHVMWNGHLDFIPSVFTQAEFFTSPEETARYFNGGANCHLALSGKHGEDSPDGYATDKANIDALLSKLSQRLSDLHGQQFGCVILETLEGEKHYPALNHKPKWQQEFLHFARTRPDLAINRLAMIYLDGKDTKYNFRAPDYEKLLRDNGMAELWGLALEKVSVFRERLGLDVHETSVRRTFAETRPELRV